MSYKMNKIIGRTVVLCIISMNPIFFMDLNYCDKNTKVCICIFCTCLFILFLLEITVNKNDKITWDDSITYRTLSTIIKELLREMLSPIFECRLEASILLLSISCGLKYLYVYIFFILYLLFL